MAKVVIIGAGLTGLSTAYHLEKQGFFDYKLFEKETEIGGLCRSVHQDGFTFDFTGHLLHINDPYFKVLVEDLVGLDYFNNVVRRSFIYSHGVHTPYPFQTNLYGLPENVIAECIEGFVMRDKSTTADHNYEQWVLKHFGAGLAKHFFFPYQKKIFDYDTHKLTSSWTGRFVPSTSLAHIIRGALTQRGDDKIGYNATFFYPHKGGISSWVKTYAGQLINPIATEFCVQSVNLKKKIVTFTNGHIEPFQKLISTMPLDLLLKNLQEPSDSNLQPAHQHLLCNSVVNFNLGIAEPNLTDKSWIYYPEKRFPFYRIGFPHTFSQHMTPPQCSSLYGELSHLNKSPETVNNMLLTSLASTQQLLGIQPENIITKKIITIKHAYVIYNHWREKHLGNLHQQLNLQSVYSVGRYGEWKYASMQEAILDGKKTAKTILSQSTHKQFIAPRKQTSQKSTQRKR